MLSRWPGCPIRTPIRHRAWSDCCRWPFFSNLEVAVGIAAVPVGGVPVVALLARVDHIIATAWLHAVCPAGIWRGVGVLRPVVAFLPELHDTVAADLEVAVGITEVAVDGVPVVALLAELLDTVAAYLEDAVGIAAVPDRNVPVVALMDIRDHVARLLCAMFLAGLRIQPP